MISQPAIGRHLSSSLTDDPTGDSGLRHLQLEWVGMEGTSKLEEGAATHATLGGRVGSGTALASGTAGGPLPQRVH
jgi:hypothetical protein